ncbi:MAG TPA: OmpA family protein [Polyangiaceae bacterium LLY-WYZ-15_(1-7)]|nr:flagellar motor protein MotB [Myxococcales bacterium]MAT27947.1 flagellar motor protein MotB [Sandaracinus sp.]HJK94503.1 OmpA family protein [Polyangiaceae bacterium LLY-WYZ-15_(1-7)]MBJ71221.1 flagellar motor protein MotB [Sandaracinus sp.]HJL06091.1 OmpA family protein [Polyangiaceae bacterium LLY-WYZ-15_(1-7)]
MRQVRRSALFGLMMAAIVGTGSTASAQEAGQLNSGGWDLHLFRPAIDSKGHLSVNGSDILGHTDFSFGLVLDYGRGLLPFRGFVNDGTVMAGEAERVDRLVDNYFTGTLHFNIGLFNYVVVGFQLPIIFLQGQNVTVPGVYNTNDNITLTGGNDAQGIGDLTIHAKARILRAERDPIGLAAILRAQLPTGNDAQFTGEPGFTLWPSIVAEWRPVRRFRLSLEAGYRFNVGDGATIPLDSRTEPSETNAFGAMFSDRGTDLTYDDLITFGLGASIRAADSLDIVLESYGTQIATEFGTTGAFSAEALLGLKIFVQANSYLVLAGGAGFPRPSAQAADFRAVAGFIFEPSIGDRDGDGYKDDVDECPDEPEDFDNFADEEGCPDPDNDRDGILDVDDECPLVPEDRDGDADEDGCPEGNEGDRDGDGILDDVDECPDDPEDRDGFEDEDGCPDPDNDQDGILDQDDLCPNDPEDMDDFQDEDGCPDPDNDNDRILDVDDSCPTDPETYNGFEDEDGCPDRGSVVIEDNSIIILEKIYFETDSAVIQRRSYPIIDAVAATLNGNPQIRLVEIQGHADERGGDDYNLRLTRDRAASVVEAVVQRGVSRDRLRSAGYGEFCPVDPRSNAEAWEQNRRVEFKIIATEDGPTGVEVACPAGRHLVPE